MEGCNRIQLHVLYFFLFVAYTHAEYSTLIGTRSWEYVHRKRKTVRVCKQRISKPISVWYLPNVPPAQWKCNQRRIFCTNTDSNARFCKRVNVWILTMADAALFWLTSETNTLPSIDPLISAVLRRDWWGTNTYSTRYLGQLKFCRFRENRQAWKNWRARGWPMTIINYPSAGEF